MAGLKVFEGFGLDMAAEFSALSKGEIRWIVEQKIVRPHKDDAGSYMYSFSELLMLRLIRLLKLNHVKVNNIKKASQYLKTIDPKRSLSNLMLYIQADAQEILYLGEQPQKGILVNMSRFGQLMQSNLLIVLPVGRDLEHVRKDVIDLDGTLSSRLKSRKLIPMEDVFKKYGIG